MQNDISLVSWYKSTLNENFAPSQDGCFTFWKKLLEGWIFFGNELPYIILRRNIKCASALQVFSPPSTHYFVKFGKCFKNWMRHMTTHVRRGSLIIPRAFFLLYEDRVGWTIKIIRLGPWCKADKNSKLKKRNLHIISYL